MENNINLKPTTAQQEAIECINKNLQIIACAGAGKTEVISRRIANILERSPDMNLESIVAFTFTNNAADSLKSRIKKAVNSNIESMYIGTIHSFCKALLSKYTEKFTDFKILDTVKTHLFISRYANHCGIITLGLKPCYRNNELFLQCIDKLIDDYDNNKCWNDIQRDALNQYIDCLYSHNYIDFSLLIFETLRQIKESPAVQEYLSGLKHLIVDEYQDVNDLQEKLISTIASYGAKICVVGDDDQTIYQFRGSNADNMISFPKRYADVHQVELEENFRCQKGIVDVAYNVIKHNKQRLNKKMHSSKEDANSTVCAKGFSSKEEEFSFIAKQIVKFHDAGVLYNNIAILFRKSKNIESITKILEANGIPYRADSSQNFFDGDYFNRFIETIKFLDTLDKSKLYLHWKDITKGALFNEGFKFLRSCTNGRNLNLHGILAEFCRKINFLSETVDDIEERIASLNGALKILDDYEEIYGDYQLSARISGILKFLGTDAQKEYKSHSFYKPESNIDAVQLMTVHKAKGLEFDIVFLPQLNKHEFPASRIGGRQYYHVLGDIFADNKEKYATNVDDERKLFYVAVTRARKNLFISYTLEDQPVSEFVANAAESSYMQINKSDLYYQPRTSNHDSELQFDPDNLGMESQWKFKQIERKVYWEMVKVARTGLHDYYYVANRFCKGIILEYSKICKQGPDAILEKAQELGII